MVREWRIGVALALGLSLAGCVAALLGDAPNSGTASDTRARSGESAPVAAVAADQAPLALAVRQRLAADPALRGATLQVSSRGTVVTLRGMARNSEQRAAAARVALATSGVVSVNNQLKVP